MLVAIAYCQKDQQQAEWLSGWMAELGPYPNHRLLVARDLRSTKENLFVDVGFASVKEIVIKDDAWNSWPISCNNAFRTVGKNIEFGTREPWLWLEPDAIPLCQGWLDAIAEEYLQAGKPFMGSRVAIANTPVHLSGISVYPGVLSEYAGIAYLAHDVAWDCMAAHQIVPKAHFTNLIDHHWQRDGKTKENLNVTFASWEQVEREVSKEAVIYHASKDGSLIERLREHKRNGELIATTPMIPLEPELPSEIKTSHELKFAEPLPNHRDILVYPWEGQTPWQSKEDSLAEIQRLADRLKQFCGHSSHVRAVRMILNDTGVITLPYRYKKRGKWKKRRKKKT